MPQPDKKSASFFANELRSARLATLADAEAFDKIIHVVERLGYYLTKEEKSDQGYYGNLQKYTDAITEFANRSCLSNPSIAHQAYLTPFSRLYKLVKEARNDALHQGAFARHLTKHLIELAIILEDALRTIPGLVVSDFMVRNPECAELWKPLSFIRQQMLANSYSYLPVVRSSDDEPIPSEEWKIVSDVSIAQFLGPQRSGEDRIKRLSKTLQEAIDEVPEICVSALVIPDNAQISEALDNLKKQGVMLVKHKDRHKDRHKDSHELVGILTAFDLL
jgi:hypothetical protein